MGTDRDMGKHSRNLRGGRQPPRTNSRRKVPGSGSGAWDVMGKLSWATWRGTTRIVGIDVTEAFMPLLGVSFLSNWAFSALWSFVGIWAIHVLRATPTAVGVMYTADSAASVLCGYYGGRLSDRVGRRHVMGGAWALEALAALALAFVRHHIALGMGLVIVAGAASGPGIAAAGALVADMSDDRDSTANYAAFRVAGNLGAMAGPALAGWVLIGGHWPLVFVGVAAMGLIAAGVAWWGLPATGTTPVGVLATRVPRHDMWRDTSFVLLLASTFGGYLVYVGYDVMLPIAAVRDYGLKPSVWGFLAVVNPLMVVALQGRLTRWAVRFHAGGVLLASMSLMGMSFLVLLVRHGAAFVLMSLLLFAMGEIVWSPTAQAFAAELASDTLRGTYMGALGSAGSAAWILGPLVDLRLADTGLLWVWILLAVCGFAAGTVGWGSVRLRTRSAHRPIITAVQRSERRNSRRKE